MLRVRTACRLGVPLLASVALAALALAPHVLSQAATAPAAPTGAVSGTPLDPGALHVTGLTALNAGPVEIALEDIAHPSWRCVACEVNQKVEGPCPTCKEPMIQIAETLLTGVEVDVTAGTIRFEVLQGEQVRLSEIEAAVKRFRIGFPLEQQFLPHNGMLLVSGPKSAEDVTKLVTALHDSKLFEKVSGRYDFAQTLAELTVRCVGAPARSAFEAALAKVAPGDALVDIVYLPGLAAPPDR